MAVRWTHLTITVADFDRSIGFYTDFCGFAVLRDRRSEGGSTVWIGPPAPDDQLPIFLLVLMEGEVASRLDHLGFQCDSRAEVDAIAARGRELGIIVHPPTDSGGSVGYWTMIGDPDGHLVEFTYGQPIKGLN